ncbi:MAG: helix-turn-helix domain containing protein [Cyanothece sp. SIO1E1]|nr:helix-turn-helix domain containing protein [Cyanothece sp. SIO1E1]
MPLTREITPETQHLLARIYRPSRHHQVRQRAHCLLLPSQGTKNVALRAIFAVSEKTLYNWFNAWNDKGLVGLYDRPGRGRNPKLNHEQQAQVQEWAKASPRNLKPVLEKIKATWDVTLSLDTLKRILKNASSKPSRWVNECNESPLRRPHRQSMPINAQCWKFSKTWIATAVLTCTTWMKWALRWCRRFPMPGSCSVRRWQSLVSEVLASMF